MPLGIPASQIVSVVPSVISAGGNALNLSGLMLTNSPRVPIGSVLSFPSQLAVASFFGATSLEALRAGDYFLGFDGSTVKPGAMLFSQYAASAVGAWLLGGTISSLTLTQLQAINGTLVVVVDGVTKTAGALDLTSATSFSAAALLMATALSLTPVPNAHVTASQSTTVLNVTAVTDGVLAVNQVLSGGSIVGGTTILAQLTGTPGGIGTYTVSTSGTVSSTAVTASTPGVQYDSVRGAFQVSSSTTGVSSTMSFATGTTASALGLTAANGATLSQGAIASTPATAMNNVIAQAQNWASFMTSWDATTADKVAFAAWNNGQNNRFLYVLWNTTLAAAVVPDTTTSGALIQAAGYSGTMLIHQSAAGAGNIAAFAMGCVASLDFGATNGRATLAFRSQSGIGADVLDATTSANLQTNGYNYMGTWDTANQAFTFLHPGSVTGPFKWADSYVNQIWMNNGLQLAMMTLLTQMKSIPYNAAGYGLIRAAALDPIQAAVNFGAIRIGVTLSNLQKAEVNTAAGVQVDDVLSNRGWFFQVKDAAPIVRGARQSPPISFWYMDGQSVQRINLASVDVM